MFLLSPRGSYHGGSPQAMGLTSNAAYKYPIANGLGCTNVCTTLLSKEKYSYFDYGRNFLQRKTVIQISTTLRYKNVPHVL